MATIFLSNGSANVIAKKKGKKDSPFKNKLELAILLHLLPNSCGKV